jgi:hypothetical protein
LTVFGGRNTFDRDIFSLSYDYRRYRLAWRLLLQYEEAVATDDLEVVARAIDREVQLGFSYPLWLAGRWTLDVAGAGAWERDEKFSGAIVETAFPLLQLRANYARGQSLALLPVSAFSLTTSYREYDTGPAFASRMAWNREVGEAIFGQDSDQELHLSLQQFSSVAQRNELELEPAGGTLEPDTTAGAFDTTAASLRSGIDLQRILKTGLRLTVPFETPIYHRWIPLGLRRLAPYVGTNYFDLTVYDGTETGARSSFVERVAGLSAEILFAHQFPLSLSVEGGTNNKPDQFNLSVHLGANRSF